VSVTVSDHVTFWVANQIEFMSHVTNMTTPPPKQSADAVTQLNIVEKHYVFIVQFFHNNLSWCYFHH